MTLETANNCICLPILTYWRTEKPTISMFSWCLSKCERFLCSLVWNKVENVSFVSQIMKLYFFISQLCGGFHQLLLLGIPKSIYSTWMKLIYNFPQRLCSAAQNSTSFKIYKWKICLQWALAEPPELFIYTSTKRNINCYSIQPIKYVSRIRQENNWCNSHLIEYSSPWNFHHRTRCLYCSLIDTRFIVS